MSDEPGRTFQYVRVYVPKNYRMRETIHCANELEFLRLLDQWNRGSCSLPKAPEWHYYSL